MDNSKAVVVTRVKTITDEVNKDAKEHELVALSKGVGHLATEPRGIVNENTVKGARALVGKLD